MVTKLGSNCDDPWPRLVVMVSAIVICIFNSDGKYKITARAVTPVGALRRLNMECAIYVCLC